MRPEFCPDLQKEWRLENISIDGLSSIKIEVYEIEEIEKPSLLGRDYSDIDTYPEIFRETAKVLFLFEDTEDFNIRDDSSFGLSMSDNGEGKTFQRLFDSELINKQNEYGKEGLKHYCIVCLNEIIDILCWEPPRIVAK